MRVVALNNNQSVTHEEQADYTSAQPDKAAVPDQRMASRCAVNQARVSQAASDACIFWIITANAVFRFTCTRV